MMKRALSRAILATVVAGAMTAAAAPGLSTVPHAKRLVSTDRPPFILKMNRCNALARLRSQSSSQRCK